MQAKDIIARGPTREPLPRKTVSGGVRGASGERPPAPIETSNSFEAFLFQPDSVLTNDYLETIRRTSYTEPEKELMLAVLEDGVSCFQRNLFAGRPRDKTQFQEAEDWILEESRHWLFSFEIICEALDIDADFLRSKLIGWKQSKLQEFSKKSSDTLGLGFAKRKIRQITLRKATSVELHSYQRELNSNHGQI